MMISLPVRVSIAEQGSPPSSNGSRSADSQLQSNLVSDACCNVGQDVTISARTPILHNQIVKIKEEYQHLGEDVTEGLSPRERLAILHFSSHMKYVFQSNARPPLPSPLEGASSRRSINLLPRVVKLCIVPLFYDVKGNGSPVFSPGLGELSMVDTLCVCPYPGVVQFARTSFVSLKAEQNFSRLTLDTMYERAIDEGIAR